MGDAKNMMGRAKRIQVSPEKLAQRRKDNIILLVLVIILGCSYAGYKYYKKNKLTNGVVTMAHVDMIGVNSKADSYRYTFALRDTVYHGVCNNEKHDPVVLHDSLFIRYDPNDPANNEAASGLLITKSPVK